MNSYKTESFKFDHTKVSAPFIRLASTYELSEDIVIEKYDIRLKQPNGGDYIKPSTIHTMEHLLSESLREVIDGVIDISPMGCLTGFYLTVIGPHNLSSITNLICDAFYIASRATEIPAENPVQCGNYLHHDLEDAKRELSEFIDNMMKEGIK